MREGGRRESRRRNTREGRVIRVEKCEVEILFFFFQAEDGIRDWSVTGVQTCALPIYTVIIMM